MSVRVNPPPQIRIPQKFFNDPELRSFFEQQQLILFQLFNRTGGSSDIISSLQQLNILNIDNEDKALTNDHYSYLIVVKAETQDVTITMPPITSDDIGKSIIILLLNSTFDCYVAENDSGTVLGDDQVLINGQYDAVHFTAISLTEWVAR